MRHALRTGVVRAGVLAGSAGLILSTAGGAAIGSAAIGSEPGATGDWPAYLYGPAHSSYSKGQTTIRPANVGRLVVKWRFRGDRPTKPGQPHTGYLASPTVVDGDIYIGADTGWFYKLNAATGHVLAKRFIGFQRAKTCFPARGFVDTATVAADRSGEQVVYVGGANGYLYALRASDLSVKWRSVIARPSRTVSNFFQWSSPTVAAGRIYIGVASNCDQPLVRAGLISYSQSNGVRRATFRPLPRAMVGASIWSSAAVGPDHDVYASTGNAGKRTREPGRSDSIVKLTPLKLRVIRSFKVPRSEVVGDGDFGASPVIFGPLVGACNKNGIFYALRRSTMTVAWKRRVGAPAPHHGISNCSAGAVYDGRVVYVATPRHVINGTAFPGSVQALNPRTGALIWQAGLPNGVIGTPTMGGGGVLAVGTYDFTKTPNAIYLLRASDGKILRRLNRGSQDFAQSVFADGLIVTANGDGLAAWGLPT
jgi:outer membrane protein assembly factor BamB